MVDRSLRASAHRRRAATAIGFGAAVVVAVCDGAGAPPDRDAQAPIEMTADGNLTIDMVKRIGRARGNVIIRRRDFVVCCDEAEARYGAKTIEKVSCRGNVVIHTVGPTRITAGWAEFRVAADRLVLRGGVVVWRPRGRLTGRRIEYDLSAERLDVSGPGSSLVFSPDGGALPAAARSCPQPTKARR